MFADVCEAYKKPEKFDGGLVFSVQQYPVKPDRRTDNIFLSKVSPPLWELVNARVDTLNSLGRTLFWLGK